MHTTRITIAPLLRVPNVSFSNVLDGVHSALNVPKDRILIYPGPTRLPLVPLNREPMIRHLSDGTTHTNVVTGNGPYTITYIKELVHRTGTPAHTMSTNESPAWQHSGVV